MKRLILILSLTALFTLNAFGTIRVVDLAGGGDYTSIHEAVNDAADNDTILVMSGTYLFSASDGEVRVENELVIIGSGYDLPENGGTTIESVGNAFNFAAGSETSVLRGFRINGVGAPLINVATNEVIIEENLISNGYNGQYTIYMVSTQRDTIRNNIFTAPEGTSSYGPYIYATTDVHVAGNIFAGMNQSAIITRQNTNLVISNNAFLSNNTHALYIGYVGADSPTVFSNIFMNTTAGQALLMAAGSATISYNAFYNNADDGTVGISPVESNPLFVNFGQSDDYDENSYDSDGYDLHLSGSSPCIDSGNPLADWNDFDPGSNGLRNDMGAYGGPWPIGSNGAPTIPVVNTISVTPATVSPSGTITIEATGRIGE